MSSNTGFLGRNWVNPWRANRRLRAHLTIAQERVRNQRTALAQTDAALVQRKKLVQQMAFGLRSARRRLWIEAERRYDSNQRQRARIDEMHATLMDIFNHGDSYSSRRAAMALAIRRDDDSLIEQMLREVSA